MKKNILYLLSSYNRFTGTPKKTFDLIESSENNSFLYVWSVAYSDEFKNSFATISQKIYEGDYGRNIIKHSEKILKIIDNNNIEVIQTHFFFGELLAGIVKLFRPKVKLLVSFEGSMSAGFLKRNIQKQIYKNVDAFIYVSKYVKIEKEKVFAQLKEAKSIVIYNGTHKLLVDEKIEKKPKDSYALLSVSSLISIKNIDILIDAMHLLKINNHTDIFLFIVGDGVQKRELEEKVKEKKLDKTVLFLGSQKGIGNLLEMSDALVHPCPIEGFGLAVVEAMMAEKPVIVSKSGALLEIIEHNKTGILVNPFKAEDWQNAILDLKINKELANEMAKNASIRARQDFSIKNFANNYNLFYKNL